MPGMTPEDVYRLTGAADPRLSPDGSTVAFNVWRVDAEKNTYPATIMLAPADGSSEPRAFTTGEFRDGSQRWSPDGTMLAFTSARKDKEPAQIYVIPVSGGGEARKLTDLKESASSLDWSPDARSIAFAARVRDDAYDEEDERKRAPRRIRRLQFKLDNEGWTTDRRTHIFVVPADGSASARQITDGDFEDASPVWSPDGARIAFASARHDDWDVEPAGDIFVLDPDGGEPEQLTDTDGFYDSPSWSPDGTRIACRWTRFEWASPWHTQIAVIDVATRAVQILTASLDRNCGTFPPVREPVWDGDDILFCIEDGGNTPLYRVPSDGSRAPEPVLTGERALTGFDLANGTLVYTATTPTTVPELFNGDTQLTAITASTGLTPIAAERFTARSKDGSEVDAWVMKPAGFEPGKRYPVLLNIHGGPFTQYGNRFFDEFQVYTGAGYVVLFSNPRGSSGYSEDWGRAIRGPANGAGPGWGTVDYEDVMAVVDTALERFDFIDPARMGVLGGSYGGYMTSWIVGHTDRFTAALSERALNDSYSFYGSSDFGPFMRDTIGANPWEDLDSYFAMSPVTYADKINTPLMIMHSENDLRCNIEQAESLFARLRTLRKEVEFVRFPGESHELTRSGSPSHRAQRFDVVLEWFARYLKPETA